MHIYTSAKWVDELNQGGGVFTITQSPLRTSTPTVLLQLLGRS